MHKIVRQTTDESDEGLWHRRAVIFVHGAWRQLEMHWHMQLGR